MRLRRSSGGVPAKTSQNPGKKRLNSVLFHLKLRALTYQLSAYRTLEAQLFDVVDSAIFETVFRMIHALHEMNGQK